MSEKKQLKAFLAVCEKTGVKVKDGADLEKAKKKYTEALTKGAVDMSKLSKEDGILLKELGYDVKITEVPAPEPEKKAKDKKEEKESSASSESGSSEEADESEESGSSSSESSASGSSSEESEESGSKSSDEESGSGSGSSSSEEADGKDEKAKAPTVKEWLAEYFKDRKSATKSEISAAFAAAFGEGKDGTLQSTLSRAKSDPAVAGKLLAEEKTYTVVEDAKKEKSEKKDKKDKGKK